MKPNCWVAASIAAKERKERIERVRDFISLRALSSFVAMLFLLLLPTVVQAQFAYTTNNGTITITGYTGPGGAVTIPSAIDGLPVTSIGQYAFAYTGGPININIPNSITNIGHGVFDGCRSLTAITVDALNPVYSSVDGALFDKSQNTLIRFPEGKGGSYTIPNSVTTIGDWVFRLCDSLTNVTIPDSVTSIGSWAFYHCSSLTSVTIGNSVTNIGVWAFHDCSSLTSITIPDSVTRIDNGAFYYCTSLTNLTIGNSVTTIGASAFGRCTRLSSITIPSSVTGIGDWAFCMCSSLTSVVIPDRVTTISDGAFSSCTSLAAITVDASNPAYASVDGVLFNKSQTTLIAYPAGKTGSYTISNSVTNIGNYAFYGCTSLPSLTIGNASVALGSFVFWGCDSLPYARIGSGAILLRRGSCAGSVTIQPTIDGLPVTHLGDGLFSGCTSLTSVTIPDSVTSIGQDAFAGCIDLTGVTIPNSVTSIRDWAFRDCLSLTTITIPDSVISIGDEAFSGCSRLTEVYFNGNSPSVGSSVFDGANNATVYYSAGTTGWGPTFGDRLATLWDPGVPCAYTIANDMITITKYIGAPVVVIIPSSMNGLIVTSIGDWAFRLCDSLTNVTIPDSVTNIGAQAFFNCTSLTSIAVDSANPSYSSLDGVLFDKSQTTLIQYPAGKTGAYIIPNSVTSIGNWAFFHCYSLNSVTISNSVTTIGGGAFSWCTSLTNVTIPDSVTTIGDWAFHNCTSLTTVTIPSSVTRIGEGAFSDCSGLTNILLPEGLTNIPKDAFSGCTALTSLTIPNGVTSIENGSWSWSWEHLGQGEMELRFDIHGAFAYCATLTNVTLPSSLTNIGTAAFAACPNLLGLCFYGNAPSFGEHVFSGEDVFNGNASATVYYLPGTTGWDTTFGGRPTAPWLLPHPVILTTAPNFGIQTNAFSFRISWATNVPVVVEASANLSNWLSLSTNTLTDGWCYFSDTGWTSYPARFYRVRQW